MKILIATGIYPPDIGGPATYSKIIGEELTRRGHSIVILTYGNCNDPGVVCVSRKIPKGLRHAVYFLKTIWHGARADIIFAQDPVSVGLPSSLAAILLRKKFIVKIVGDYAWEQGMQRFGVKDLLDDFLAHRYGARVELLRRIQFFTARRAKVILVPSDYLKSVVARWGISEKFIQVIPNSARAPRLLSKNEAKKKLGLEGRVLLSAGRFVPWKGFGMLVELAGRLHKKMPFTLVILGDGPERVPLEALKNRLKLDSCVFMPGRVSKDILDLYLASSDAFLLNTAYEGFSHQLLEAMIAGVPIIATNAGGNKEILIDGENAIIAAYNDQESWTRALERFFEDSPLRARMANEGRRLKDHFTIDDMMSSLVTCFESL